MLPSLIAGLVALAIAIGFLAVLLAKLQIAPLWAVVMIGIVMMLASVIEGVRQERGGS